MAFGRAIKRAGKYVKGAGKYGKQAGNIGVGIGGVTVGISALKLFSGMPIAEIRDFWLGDPGPDGKYDWGELGILQWVAILGLVAWTYNKVTGKTIGP